MKINTVEFKTENINTFSDVLTLIDKMNKVGFTRIEKYPIKPENTDVEPEKILIPACIKKDTRIQSAYKLIVYADCTKMAITKYNNVITDCIYTMNAETEKINEYKKIVFNRMKDLYSSKKYKELKSNKDWNKLSTLVKSFRTNDDEYVNAWDKMQKHISEYIKARNKKVLNITYLEYVKTHNITLSYDNETNNNHYIVNVCNIKYTNNACIIMANLFHGWNIDCYPRVNDNDSNGNSITVKNSFSKIFENEFSFIDTTISNTINRFNKELTDTNKAALSNDCFKAVKEVLNAVITINKALFLDAEMCNTHYSYKARIAPIISLLRTYDYRYSDKGITRTKHKSITYFKDIINMSLYEYYHLNKPEKTGETRKK